MKFNERDREDIIKYMDSMSKEEQKRLMLVLMKFEEIRKKHKK